EGCLTEGDPAGNRSELGQLGRELLERAPGRLLLGGLLRAALADAELLAVDDGRAREVALVRRPLGREDLVGDVAAEPRQRLLQLRLVVDVRRQRVLDPGRERLHDRVLDPREAVLE